MRMFLTLVLIMMSSAFVMAQENYGFKVAGVYVTSDNYLDLTEINGVSGKVYFDPNTRTLTLDNATIEAAGSNAILNQDCKYLVIELIGTNTINVTNSAGIYLQKETSILGTSGSKLTITNDQGAVLFENSPLEINNCWLEVEGKWGISASNNEAAEVLTIRNSHVEANGTSGSICDISGLKLEGSYIYSPYNAAYDADTKSVAVNGVTVKEKVVIEPGYGFKIAGVDVTALNCKDLSVIDGVDGKISYDPETNTLAMEDVTINATGNNNGIWNRGIKGLKIEVVGNNVITTSEEACFTINKTSTISGPGTLRLKSSENCGIYVKSSLTVEGVKLYAEGYYGVAGIDGRSGEILTLRNSYVEATGSSGSICDLQNLVVLDGYSITQPTGAAFDANVHAVALNGKVVTDKVVIESDNNSIGTITADVPARKQGIYNLNGVKLTQQWDDLPAGIYIVDGVKRVKN